MAEVERGERRPDGAEERSGAYALMVALGIFLSRIFGLVRQRAIAHFLGSGTGAGAFFAAIRIPNFLQNLFGEGVLSASMIPVYAKLIAEKDEEMAGRVGGAIVAFLMLIVSVLVLIGVLLSPLLVSLIAPGFVGTERELTITLVRILFPGAGLLVMSAWCLGILNSHRKFFLSYVAPVIWNVAMIATLVVFGARLGEYSLAIALGWGTVVGSALQFGVQLPFVLRYAPAMRLALETRLEPVREVARNFLPVVAGRGVVQVSAFIDEIIVSFLSSPTVAILAFAHILYLLPISLFGMSVAASELPQMSSVLGSRDEIHAALQRRLRAGLRQISFFVIPSAIAFLMIGDVLIAGVFQTGEFGPSQTTFTWMVLGTFALGLLPITLSRLYSSTFYALRDTRTPLKIATIRVVVAATIGYLLAVPLRPWLATFVFEVLGLPAVAIHPTVPATVSIGLMGVAFGSAIGGWIEMFLLRSRLARRIGRVPSAIAFELKILGAAVVAGLAAVFAGRPLAPFIREMVTEVFSINEIAVAAAVAIVFGIAYLFIALVLRVDEAKNFVRRIPLASKFLAR
jgi:putative peptidoglycan lipid II flippase